MPLLRPAATFAQDFDEIIKRLAKYGEVYASDETGQARRSINFLVEVPGYGLPTAATLDYREEFKRSAQGWLRYAYIYEYRTAAPRSRRAHHQHGAWGIHQHCEPPDVISHEHYDDVERLLLPTHEDFAELIDRSEPVRCLGLRRMRRA